jgi:putative transposase
MKDLKSLSSCKFLITYHFIFVCKYRRKVFVNEDFNNELKNKMLEISSKNDFIIDVQEVDTDHYHAMIDSIPRVAPSQICRALKQESTVYMWKKFAPYLKQFYWREKTLWSDGWFCSTIGNVSESMLKHYIQTQGS